MKYVRTTEYGLIVGVLTWGTTDTNPVTEIPDTSHIDLGRGEDVDGQPIKARVEMYLKAKSRGYNWHSASNNEIGVLVLEPDEESPSKSEKVLARLSTEAHRVLSNQHDPQQQEYERDVRLGKTPEADSKPYSYTARDGTMHSGRDALDRWGDDLRATIREAADGTLDPSETLPTPPG